MIAGVVLGATILKAEQEVAPEVVVIGGDGGDIMDAINADGAVLVDGDDECGEDDEDSEAARPASILSVVMSLPNTY